MAGSGRRGRLICDCGGSCVIIMTRLEAVHGPTTLSRTVRCTVPRATRTRTRTRRYSCIIVNHSDLHPPHSSVAPRLPAGWGVGYVCEGVMGVSLLPLPATVVPSARCSPCLWFTSIN